MAVETKLMKIFPCLKILLEIIYLFIHDIGNIIYHNLQHLSEDHKSDSTGTKIKVQITFLTE